ncbi:MAG TPA: hypothetical protein VGM34_01060 [Chlamydiales bacterium]|jgi:hypothetical protein
MNISDSFPRLSSGIPSSLSSSSPDDSDSNVDVQAVALAVLQSSRGGSPVSETSSSSSRSQTPPPSGNQLTDFAPGESPLAIRFEEVRSEEEITRLRGRLYSIASNVHLSLNEIQKKSNLDSQNQAVSKMQTEVKSLKRTIRSADYTSLSLLEREFSQKGWMPESDSIDDLIIIITKELEQREAAAFEPSLTEQQAVNAESKTPTRYVESQTTEERQAFNARMRWYMIAAYVSAIAFTALGALTHNHAFFAAAWICFELGNAALRVQKERVINFNRTEVFGCSPILQFVDFMLCSLPRKLFTFTPNPISPDDTASAAPISPTVDSHDNRDYPNTFDETSTDETFILQQIEIELEHPLPTTTPAQSPAESAPESAPEGTPQD